MTKAMQMSAHDDEEENPLVTARGVVNGLLLSVAFFAGLCFGYILGAWIVPHLFGLH